LKEVGVSGSNAITTAPVKYDCIRLAEGEGNETRIP
jgi:hypothetical protein